MLISCTIVEMDDCRNRKVQTIESRFVVTRGWTLAGHDNPVINHLGHWYLVQEWWYVRANKKVNYINNGLGDVVLLIVDA